MGCFYQRPKQRLGWIPLALRRHTLLFFVTLDLAVIVCLITLSVITSSRDGFATIGDQSVRSWNITWDLQVLWTSVPVFVFRLVGLYWDWITTPISQRQPYVDLLEDGGAPARKTVLLDYLAVPILWRWWNGFANKHSVVGSCSLLTLIMSVVVSSLAANLFVVRTVPVVTTEPLLVTTNFDALAINLNVNWVPVFDTVSAMMVYNGSPVAWTDRQYAFQPYQLQGSVEADTEITTKLQAYSAYLNCSILTDYQLEVESPHLHINANDRGCAFKQQLEISEKQEVYFDIVWVNDCSTWLSRLVFTAATFSNESSILVSNLTVLSCIPNYRVTSGDFIAVAKGDSVSVHTFHPEATNDARPEYWRTFEEEILRSETYNYRTVWSTSAFGNVILYYAQKLNAASYLASEVLQQAIAETFTAVYLTAAARHAFAPLEVPTVITGRFVSLIRRLHVVYWSTCMIIVILAFDLGTILVAVFYVYSHPSILEEEPAGLAAYAAILQKSSLMDVPEAHCEPGKPLIQVTEETKIGQSKPHEEQTRSEETKYFMEAMVAGFEDRWGAIRRPEGTGWVVQRLR